MTYPLDKLARRLRWTPEPLRGVSQTSTEWTIDSLGISKSFECFSSGWNYPLQPESRFEKQIFDIDGRRGVAIIFTATNREGGMTPQYMPGWVPLDQEARADRWIAFLNNEIAKRLGREHIPDLELGEPFAEPVSLRASRDYTKKKP